MPIDFLMGMLNILGVAVYGASGALVAANLRQNLVTFAFFALATGVGGGTLRDLLIGAPVFWVGDPALAVVCLTSAFLVWVTPGRWWRPRALDWLDAIGLAAFSVFGTAKAMGYGVDPFIAALMGVITACMGGIIRDILAGRPSILLRPEIYVTAATLAAGLYPLLLWLGMPASWAALIAFMAGFGVRGLAMVKGWALPAYAAGHEDSPLR